MVDKANTSEKMDSLMLSQAERASIKNLLQLAGMWELLHTTTLEIFF